ncbi:substrate-binding domain-containing protein [Shimia sp. MIT910701]|jgi:LacI family repressor for deo operon, udp, cdd, tsx, nupC, and nupG|uniref:substrate-binding domain-containing protein n=1 Tax=Shimia sp. MIT910701 TaxID=3096987 RepID=UPI00399B1880
MWRHSWRLKGAALEGAFKPTKKALPLTRGRLFIKDALSTAFLCVNDTTAIGLIATLRLRGFDVPREFSVIGFDDIAFASNITPALTTIRQPRNKIGERAMAIILDGLEVQSSEKTNERLHGDLVVWESCGPAGRK